MNATTMRSFVGTILVSVASCLCGAAERIVFVGDSITGQSRNHSEGYAKQLDAAYAATIADEANRPTVVSLGGSGQTVESWKSVEVNSRTKPQTTLDIPGVYVGENLGQPADRLVIMLGMNNVLSPTTDSSEQSLATFKENYRTLATNLVKRVQPADLYLASVPPFTEDPDGPQNRLLQLLNEQIRSLVQELQSDATCQAAHPGMALHYLPVWEGQTNVLARGRARAPAFHITDDRVHPNAIGHSGLAKTFLDGFGHTDASAWLDANRLQQKLDAAATANLSGLSYALKSVGDGVASSVHAFSLAVNWVVRSDETAPASAAFALTLPDGWAETAPAVTDGLRVVFSLGGPAKNLSTELIVKATPNAGAVRTATVPVPTPWLVSTPVKRSWTNLNPGWAFPKVEEDAEAVTRAILSGSGPTEIAAAQPERVPDWRVVFPSVDYLGGASAASIDFSAVEAYPTFSMAYAARYVSASKPVTVTLTLSSASQSSTLHNTVWVNGTEVLVGEKTGSADVELQRGNNLIVWRAAHVAWQWQAGLSIGNASDPSVSLCYGTVPEPQKPGGVSLGDGSYLYTFLSNGVFAATCSGRAEVLVVGGGGGGGGVGGENSYTKGGGGGGGGGDVRVVSDIAVTAGDHPVVIGAGGAQNENGESSSALGVTALGGGAGSANGVAAGSGASGGGGSGGATSGGAVAEGASGHVGGVGVPSGASGSGGGGGGAGSEGGAAGSGTSAGKGGDGRLVEFASRSGTYGAGGGGGAAGGTSGSKLSNGGAGGGGGGCAGRGNGSDGLANTGSGGGGGGSNYHINLGAGGSGGSGVVLIRFWPDVIDPGDFPGVPEVTYQTDGSIVYTYTETGLFRPPSAGTAKVFLVGGGGGGGGNTLEVLAGPDMQTSAPYQCYAGGGGGGGGVVTNDAISVAVRDYVIGIGCGGAQNQNGGTTTAFGLCAYGGGAGGVGGAPAGKAGASAGGSGSGTSGEKKRVPATAATVYETGVQGHAGGEGFLVKWNLQGGAGGGGGAGGVGGNGYTVTDEGATTNWCAGAAGVGVKCPYLLSSDVLYGAGGKGGKSDYSSLNPSNNCGAAGVDGLGQGGDGGRAYVHVSAGHGGRGGSGVAKIFFMPEEGYYRDRVRKLASGGTVRRRTVDAERWATHVFTNGGTFTVSEPMQVQAFLVGGGGAGAAAYNVRGGGGGAGGVLCLSSVKLYPGSYSVTVGTGGQTEGANGTDTVCFERTAFGGGGGGKSWNSLENGKEGGSGGGGGSYNGTDKLGGAARVAADGSTQGHKGGDGGGNAPGGGGGAESEGVAGSSSGGGAGGAPVACNWLGDVRYFAAGGGAGEGGKYGTGGGAGGRGGGVEIGGHGGWWNYSTGGLVQATDGLANTGSGGGGAGGAGNQNTQHGKGADGIVIIRYKLLPNGLTLIMK